MEIKEVKEDTVKGPVGTDLGTIDELLNKAQGSADVVSLLRQAKERCLSTKQEDCEGKLKIAFSREIKRLLDLNTQDKLKDAKELCDLYPVDNCSERIREKDAQLRFQALIDAGKNANGFEQKRSKFLEAKAFCEKNSLAVLNWNCQSIADDLLQKLHTDRYQEQLSSLASLRNFDDKMK
nr:hypothetical protein [Haliscomenobacter sp.]